ncbi:MAG: hypothetical protein ABIQ40_04135 [Bacteroidia bacterium]
MIKISTILLFILFTIAGLQAQQHTELWPNGKTKATGKMTGNFRTGKWKEFYESGSLKMKGAYKKGSASMYNGTLAGYYSGGQKWYTLVYSFANQNEEATEWYPDGKLKRTINAMLSSKDRRRIRIDATSFAPDGKQTGKQFIDIGNGIFEKIIVENGDTVKTTLRAYVLPHPPPAGVEIIKMLFFEDGDGATVSMLAKINGLLGDLGWQGKANVFNIAGQKTSDTTYYQNKPCYSFGYIYKADTLAYSFTVFEGKTYYIFRPDLLSRVFRKKMPPTLESAKYGDYIFSDYYDFPADFPDGTWLMFYPKRSSPGGIMGIEELRLINDTSRYLFSPCHFVYFQQEYKNHVAAGNYTQYYFETTPDEYVNHKLPAKADLTLPFQFNIQKRNAKYANGKRNGAHCKYLLDGKTAYFREEYVNDAKSGEYISYFHNDSLTRLTHYYTAGVLDAKGFQFRNFYTYSSPIANNCVSHYFPGEGVFCFYQEGYFTGPIFMAEFSCMGVQQYYADTITNEHYVAAKDSSHVACYIWTYVDSTNSSYKMHEYHYGKLFKVMIGKANKYRTTTYFQGKAVKTEDFLIDKNGLHQKVK